MSTTSLRSQYLVIFAAVSSYWICSIGLVFLNKYLLSSPDLKLDTPLFVTFFQCLVSVVLCLALARLSAVAPTLVTFPAMRFDARLSRQILPLSLVFVAMITFNNLCLRNVGVSFYYVGRSLTTVFNVVCSYLILGKTTSARALACCGVIVGGFFLGVDQEEVVGSLSASGVAYGVLASLFVALYAICTKKSLALVGDSVWRLTFYNNLNACLMFVPLMALAGEPTALIGFAHLWTPRFWAAMTASGAVGFVMGYVTGWQIQVTSALTHNISGTAKAAAQTVIAVQLWREAKTLLWWLSNVVILAGSAAYTYFQKLDMDRRFDESCGQPYERLPIKKFSVDSDGNSDNEKSEFLTASTADL